MDYEELLKAADSKGLSVREQDLEGYGGLIYGHRVAIRKSIPTDREKGCVLAEEIGHAETSCGDILLQDTTLSRQQELRARMYGYDLMIGLKGLVRASDAGCRSLHEAAEYLNCTDEYLQTAVEAYHKKYGLSVRYGMHVILFEPCLTVMRMEGSYVEPEKPNQR